MTDQEIFRKLAQLQDRPEILIRYQNSGADPRLFDVLYLCHIGQVGGVVQFENLSGIHVYPINHAGGGGNQIKVKFTAQTFLDNLQMQHSQKPAAVAKTKRHG